MPVVEAIKQHRLLLDTHVWIWWMAGERGLSKAFLAASEKKAKEGKILISPISIWEIGMLVEKKRLTMMMDPLDWVSKALNEPGVDLAPISPKIAIQSSRLPEGLHGDPADRLLVATAREYHAVLVTRDKKILNYGKGRFLAVHDPS